MIFQLILSLCASSAPTPVSDDVSRYVNQATTTNGFTYFAGADEACSSAGFDDFVAELEAEHGKDFFADGRKWVADTFYADQPTSIASLRLAKGWSQARLAAEASTTQAQISKIERGQQNVGLDLITDLARVLDADPTQVFSLIYAQRAARVV
ncbi:helix-turn-helix domain-containing protein [Cupriavidus taiwanensis]|uniref:helix-turn-helix domain-containing protein n=1 Tax=Cupriavidus taiwanensis TaxID=164546 RepID=UPI0039C16E21